MVALQAPACGTRRPGGQAEEHERQEQDRDELVAELETGMRAARLTTGDPAEDLELLARPPGPGAPRLRVHWRPYPPSTGGWEPNLECLWKKEIESGEENFFRSCSARCVRVSPYSSCCVSNEIAVTEGRNTGGSAASLSYVCGRPKVRA